MDKELVLRPVICPGTRVMWQQTLELQEISIAWRGWPCLGRDSEKGFSLAIRETEREKGARGGNWPMAWAQ